MSRKDTKKNSAMGKPFRRAFDRRETEVVGKGPQASLRFKKNNEKGRAFQHTLFYATNSNFDFKIVATIYLTKSTIALNASGLFIARSARALRLSATPFLARLPMRTE